MQVVGTGEVAIARVAAAQRGLVTREQLAAAGLGRGAIAHRQHNGRLHRLHRGVYLLGRESVEPLGEEMAAVLLFGGYAILSHRSAALLWGLLEHRPTKVTLTLVGKDGRVRTKDGRSRAKLELHRTGALDRRDVRTRKGLPVTSPARTVLDLAGIASTSELEKATARALRKDLVTAREIEDAIERAPRRKGSARLAEMLHGDCRPDFTRSDGERRMRRLVRLAQLPAPLVNAQVLGLEVDFFWPGSGLIVEVDGVGFHGDRAAFECDRRRDQVLVAAGLRVIRITWRQLRDEPFAVIARLAQALGHAQA